MNTLKLTFPNGSVHEFPFEMDISAAAEMIRNWAAEGECTNLSTIGGSTKSGVDWRWASNYAVIELISPTGEKEVI